MRQNYAPYASLFTLEKTQTSFALLVSKSQLKQLNQFRLNLLGKPVLNQFRLNLLGIPVYHSLTI